MKKIQIALSCVSFFCLFCISVTSCKQSSKEITKEEINKRLNKRLVIPEGLPFTVYIRDTATVDVSDTVFKIVSYANLDKCSSCQLHLPMWKKFIQEMDSALHQKVAFLYYIHPKDLMDVRYQLLTYNFDYPVCIDTADVFNKTNELQNDENLRTFLLNKDNIIIGIGNPLKNSSVRDLYFSILSKQKGYTNNTTKERISINPPTINLGEFDWHDTIHKSFSIKNLTNETIDIAKIYSSCECLKTNKNKLTLKPKSEATIELSFKSEEPEGSFYREIILEENNEKEYIICVRGISDN